MKEYEVYRLSHYHPDGDYKKVFFKKNLKEIIDYLKKQIQVNLYKIEGLDEDANFTEIDISKNFHKRYFYSDKDLKLRFVDTGEDLDYKKHSVVLVNIVLAYKDNNFKKYDKTLINDLKKLFNTDDLDGYGLNPYITIYKEASDGR